jgi:hypothetical protein
VGILRQISDGFRNVSVRPVWIAVGVAALLSLFALILLRRKVLPVLYASKNEFLESLCLLHNVAPGEKRLLVRLALEYNVPETAFLFVKAGLAFEILDRMSRSGLLGRRRAKRLAAVCRKIFGLSARSELDSLEV